AGPMIFVILPIRPLTTRRWPKRTAWRRLTASTGSRVAERMEKAAQTSDDEYLGRTLDARYRLDAVIGAGAIGRVYAGTQLAVDRKVAIKLLHPSVRGRELGAERFLREAKAVARLRDAS